MTDTSIDSRIASCASTQLGLITTAQLRALGVTRSAVAIRIANGRLDRPHPSVLRVALTPVTHDVVLLGAVLAAGDGAALSHATSGARLGVWTRAGDTPVHVISPLRRPVKHPSVIVHRQPLSPEHVRVVRGIPTCSLAWTCIDLGSALSPHQLAAVVHEASFQDPSAVRDIEALLAERGPLRGVRTIRTALRLHSEGSAGTRSRSEDRLLAALIHARCAPDAVNVRGATGLPGVECDFVWFRSRVVVEIDGPGHDRPGARASDRAVDLELESHGWLVLRIPAQRAYSRPTSTADQIARVTAERRGIRRRKQLTSR